MRQLRRMLFHVSTDRKMYRNLKRTDDPELLTRPQLSFTQTLNLLKVPIAIRLHGEILDIKPLITPLLNRQLIKVISITRDVQLRRREIRRQKGLVSVVVPGEIVRHDLDVAVFGLGDGGFNDFGDVDVHFDSSVVGVCSGGMLQRRIRFWR